MRRMLLPAMSELASTAPNARYTDADMLDMSLAMCTRNQFVTPTFRSLRKRGAETMTPQRFLQIFGRKTPDEMLETGCDVLEASVGAVVRSGRLRGPVTMAVDEHLIPCHGGESPYAKGGRKKGGTVWFEGYITAQAVSRRPSAAFAAYPIANGEAQSHYLGGPI